MNVSKVNEFGVQFQEMKKKKPAMTLPKDSLTIADCSKQNRHT